MTVSEQTTGINSLILKIMPQGDVAENLKGNAGLKRNPALQVQNIVSPTDALSQCLSHDVIEIRVV